MNVLSPASAAHTVPVAPAPSTASETALYSAVDAAAPVSAVQTFTQVWGMQAASQLDAAVVATPESVHMDGEDAASQVHAAPVMLSDVLPVLHLPAQAMGLTPAQLLAARTQALGLGEGEALEEPLETAADIPVPAMHSLSALPVVHPQLRREAVASVDASGSWSVALHGSDLLRGATAIAAPVQVDATAVEANASVATITAKGTQSSPSALVQALGQRIQMQQVQGQDVVTVRLDPPQWGRIEIRIQQDAAGVQVMLQASHAEVGRQLTAVVDSLRQELQARTGADASVVVQSHRSMAGQGQSEHHRQHGEHAGQSEVPVGQALQFQMGDDAV